MTYGVRQGLGALCFGVAVLLVGVVLAAAAEPDTGAWVVGLVIRGVGMLIAIGALALLGKALLARD